MNLVKKIFLTIFIVIFAFALSLIPCFAFHETINSNSSLSSAFLPNSIILYSPFFSDYLDDYMSHVFIGSNHYVPVTDSSISNHFGLLYSTSESETLINGYENYSDDSFMYFVEGTSYLDFSFDSLFMSFDDFTFLDDSSSDVTVLIRSYFSRYESDIPVDCSLSFSFNVNGYIDNLLVSDNYVYDYGFTVSSDSDNYDYTFNLYNLISAVVPNYSDFSLSFISDFSISIDNPDAIISTFGIEAPYNSELGITYDIPLPSNLGSDTITVSDSVFDAFYEFSSWIYSLIPSVIALFFFDGSLTFLGVMSIILVGVLCVSIIVRFIITMLNGG